MNEPEGTGSDKDHDPDEGIKLPSWIDAAISRTKEEVDADQQHQEAEPTALPDDAVEPMGDEPPTEGFERAAAAMPSSEPFPTFLDRRGSMQYESDRMAEEEAEGDQALMEEMPEPRTEEFALPGSADDFEAQRAAIVSQALAEAPPPRPDPIPLPVAPVRRRGPSGPWLMAALFFAAAALVLAILIWLRPLQQ